MWEHEVSTLFISSQGAEVKTNQGKQLGGCWPQEQLSAALFLRGYKWSIKTLLWADIFIERSSICVLKHTQRSPYA